MRHLTIWGAPIKRRDLDDFIINSENQRILDANGDAQEGARTNIRGRYPFHFHRTGAAGANPVFALAEGNAVWKSPGLGYVHHDSAANFINNASYDCVGSHFVGEAGNEIGIWEDNIAIRSHNHNIGFKNKHQSWNHDVGRPGAGFWFVGRVVGMKGNVAAGHAQVGIGHMTRGPDTIDVQSAHTEFGTMTARYLETMDNANPHIHNHHDNVVLASKVGVAVAKSSANQGHAARSILNGLTAWNVDTGIDVQYTNFYSFIDLTLIAQPGKNYRGIYYNSSVIDMVVNRAYVEGFDIGVAKSGPHAGAGTPSWGSLDFPFVDLQLVNNGTDFYNFTSPSSYQLLNSSDLVPGRLHMEFDGNSDFYANGDMSDRKIVFSGNIWDSVKAHPYYAEISLNKGLNARFLQGHYLDASGNKIIVFEEPITDSATGESLILEIPIIVDSNWNFANSASLSPYLGPWSSLTNTVDREYWTGISGSNVTNLTGNANYPNSPTGSDTLSRLEAVNWNDSSVTKDWAASYGQRIRGYIVPATSGNYTFWVAGDDFCKLWLSTDSDPANKAEIASVSGWTNQYQFNKYASQKSVTISLVAGQAYYMEVLHKEGGGRDHMSVAWSTDSTITPTAADIVPGSVLSAYSSGAPWQ